MPDKELAEYLAIQNFSYILNHIKNQGVPRDESEFIEWKETLNLKNNGDLNHFLKKSVSFINSVGGFYLTKKSRFMELNQIKQHDIIDQIILNVLKKNIRFKDKEGKKKNKQKNRLEEYLENVTIRFIDKEKVSIDDDLIIIHYKCMKPSFYLFHLNQETCFHIRRKKETKNISCNDLEEFETELFKIYKNRLLIHSNIRLFKKWKKLFMEIDKLQKKKVKMKKDKAHILSFLYYKYEKIRNSKEEVILIKKFNNEFKPILEDVYFWTDEEIEKLDDALDMIYDYAKLSRIDIYEIELLNTKIILKFLNLFLT